MSATSDLTVAQVRRCRHEIAAAALVERSSEDADGAFELIAELERLRSAAAALQARLAVRADEERRREEAAAGVPARRRGIGVAAELGLARQISVHRAQRMLGMATALVTEMPHTRRALATGRIDEWRATLLVRETACLQVEDRAEVDRRLCADPAVLRGCGDREVIARARQLSYEVDAASVTRRAAQARADRRVTLRPAPDTMTYLTALLPVAEGVAAYAALTRAGGAARAAGDERTRGQVMADTLVERLTGQQRACEVPVAVNLVMSADALLGDSEEPAFLRDHGVVTAGWARDLVGGGPATQDRPCTPDAQHARDTPRTDGRSGTGEPRDRPRSGPGAPGGRGEPGGPGALGGPGELGSPSTLGGPSEPGGRGVQGVLAEPGGLGEQGGLGAADQLVRWVRRLYRAPDSGQLVAMETRARKAPPGLAELVRLRDGGTCRMPWCDAPGRHEDHAVRHEDGGPTAAHNLQLLCETHNYAKEAWGWRTEAIGTSWDNGTEGGTAMLGPPASGARRAPVDVQQRRAGRPDLDGRIAATAHLEIRTPSGRRFRTRPPELPGGRGRRTRRPPPGEDDSDPPSVGKNQCSAMRGSTPARSEGRDPRRRPDGRGDTRDPDRSTSGPTARIDREIDR